MTGPDIGAALLVALGAALVIVALASLPTGSRLRRLYGIDDGDRAGARANAAVLTGTGAVLLALAAAILLRLPDKMVAAGALGVTALGTVALGWLVRYRDRREILTTPNVSREQARRLGGAAMWTGALLCLPLTGILLGASESALAVSTLGVTAVSGLLIALAYR